MPKQSDIQVYSIKKNKGEEVEYTPVANGKNLKVIRFGASTQEMLSLTHLEYGEGDSWDSLIGIHGVLDLDLDINVIGDGVKRLRVTMMNNGKKTSNFFYWLDWVEEA